VLHVHVQFAPRDFVFINYDIAETYVRRDLRGRLTRFRCGASCEFLIVSRSVSVPHKSVVSSPEAAFLLMRVSYTTNVPVRWFLAPSSVCTY